MTTQTQELDRILAAEVGQVELCAQVPPELHNAIAAYVKANPGWSQERVMRAALSLFLMQNHQGTSAITEIYVDAIFGDSLNPVS
jgi:hypothetical protein